MGTGRVGLISDTHGLLRPEAVAALEDCEVIVHAGDVGRIEILEQLRTIAPVHAVRGNVDTQPPLSELPETIVVEAGNFQMYVLHDIGDLDLHPEAAGFDAVISGHSHRPGRFTKSGVLYINPGSAGPKRFDLPVTLARLDLSRPEPAIEWIDLLSGRELQPGLATNR